MKIICTPSPKGVQENYVEVSCDSRTNEDTATQAIELAAAALVAYGFSQDNVIEAMSDFVDEYRKLNHD